MNRIQSLDEVVLGESILHIERISKQAVFITDRVVMFGGDYPKVFNKIFIKAWNEWVQMN